MLRGSILLYRRPRKHLHMHHFIPPFATIREGARLRARATSVPPLRASSAKSSSMCSGRRSSGAPGAAEWRQHERQRSERDMLEKISSGIEGFDDITAGGLPLRRTTLLMGGPGCGKTVLALQMLVSGATRHGTPGIFVAFEENARRVSAERGDVWLEHARAGEEAALFRRCRHALRRGEGRRVRPHRAARGAGGESAGDGREADRFRCDRRAAQPARRPRGRVPRALPASTNGSCATS